MSPIVANIVMIGRRMNSSERFTAAAPRPCRLAAASRLRHVWRVPTPAQPCSAHRGMAPPRSPRPRTASGGSARRHASCRCDAGSSHHLASHRATVTYAPRDPPTRCTRATIRRDDRDARALAQTRLAVGHHLLARIQPGGDDRQLADGATRRHLSRLRRLALRVDDVHEGAPLAGLDRGRGHGEHAALHTGLHAEEDELARPHARAAVAEHGATRHGAGERIDRVVQEVERADLFEFGAVARRRGDGEWTRRDGGA